MQLSERAADDKLLDAPIRSRADFQAALERRATFSLDASARLDMLVNWLNLALGVRKTLDSFATHWPQPVADRSEEHTSELQSLMRISYAVFCLNKKKHLTTNNKYHTRI